ncbi:hypothetical protein ATCC90586_011035 [Pythium insidiosum]|nr:hypothetical protein ATCC90586_011035 [Pythium insidiosum]
MIITLHSSTFMVYRLLTVVLWLLRLAFEVLCCSEQELMLIRGPLEDGYVVVPDTLTRDELRVLRRESEQLFRSLDDDPEIAAARVLEQVQLGATRFPASYRRICVTSAVCLRRAASST